MTETSSWTQEALDVVRAGSGGLLFGVPLLYTMEVWWTGTHTQPEQSLAVLALLVVPAFVLNKTAGFRSSKDVELGDAVADTIEAVAIGLVITAVVLALLREIEPATPVAVALGKVVYEAIPFCLGVGLARHVLDPSRVRDDDDADDDTAPAALADLGAATVGSVFIALSIAPTDEVPMIASAMTPLALLALIAFSLLASYGIVFAADFTGQNDRRLQSGAFQHPLTETVVAYLVALVCSAGLLWLFQRADGPPADLLTRVIILGFPAAIGGAAGRLAL